MNEQSFLSGTRVGTAGGTLTVVLLNINSGDVIKTMVLAAIGAAVSFVTAQLLKKMMQWWKTRKQ